jgi:hypothetical protein
LVIGAALSLAIGVGVPYGALVIMGSQMSSLNAPAAFFLIFLLVGIVQVLLGLIRRKWILGRGELLTIYIMMVVATAFSGGERNGFCMMLLSNTAGVFYLATPENEWVERVHPYVADWMVPHDELGIQWFSRGCRTASPSPGACGCHRCCGGWRSWWRCGCSASAPWSSSAASGSSTSI